MVEGISLFKIHFSVISQKFVFYPSALFLFAFYVKKPLLFQKTGALHAKITELCTFYVCSFQHFISAHKVFHNPKICFSDFSTFLNFILQSNRFCVIFVFGDKYHTKKGKQPHRTYTLIKVTSLFSKFNCLFD